MAYAGALPPMPDAYGMPPGYPAPDSYSGYYNQPPPPPSQSAPPGQPYYYGGYAQPPPDPNQSAQPPVAYPPAPTAYPGVTYPQPPAPPPISAAPPPPMAPQYGAQATPYPPQPVQPPAGTYGQPSYGADPYQSQQYYQTEQSSYDEGGQQGYAGFGGSSSQAGPDSYGDPQQQPYYRMSGSSGYGQPAPTQPPQPLMSVTVGRGAIAGARGMGMDRGYKNGRVGGPTADNRAGYGQQGVTFGSETEEVTELPDSILAQGIGQRADENIIYQYFSQCGSIKLDDTQRPKIWIYKDKSGLPKGECTVTFDDPTSADYAIQNCNGQIFPGANAPMTISRATISTPIIAIPPKNFISGGSVDSRGRGGFMARGGSVGSGGSRGFDRGRGGPMKRSGGNTEARQGDWICDECGNNNFSFRVECNQCSARKPDSQGGMSSRGGFVGGSRGMVAGRGGPRSNGIGRGGMGSGGRGSGAPGRGTMSGGRGIGNSSNRGRGDRMGGGGGGGGGGGPMMRQRGGMAGRARPY